MKILFLDIETTPNQVWTWGLWNQNISQEKIIKSQKVLCWAAKWYGKDGIIFDSIKKSGEKKMIQHIHKLLDEADVVVHYYGKKFDIPHLNTQFINLGLTPPSPYKQIDLKEVSFRAFRFPSNKLAYVSRTLKIGKKLEEGVVFDLWIGCMNGDAKSWAKMEEYNRQDTLLLESLYEKYKPWIKNHPNHGSYGKDKEVCPSCGKNHLHRRGFAVAQLKKYPRFQCQDCFSWFRSNVAIPNKKVTRNVSI